MYIIIIATMFSIYSFSSASTSADECSRKLLESNRKMDGNFYTVASLNKSWEEGWMCCHKTGGFLATVLNQRDFDCLAKLLQSQNIREVFLGAHYARMKEWKSVDGDAATCGHEEASIGQPCCFGRKNKNGRVVLSKESCSSVFEVACERKVINKKVGWFKARQLCIDHNLGNIYDGRSMTVPSNWEVNTSYWIGVSAAQWLWNKTGKMVTFSRWGSEGWSNGKKCLTMKKYNDGNYFWASSRCSTEKQFVCQQERKTLHTGQAAGATTRSTGTLHIGTNTFVTIRSTSTFKIVLSLDDSNGNEPISAGDVIGPVFVILIILVLVCLLIFFLYRKFKLYKECFGKKTAIPYRETNNVISMRQNNSYEYPDIKDFNKDEPEYQHVVDPNFDGADFVNNLDRNETGNIYNHTNGPSTQIVDVNLTYDRANFVNGGDPVLGVSESQTVYNHLIKSGANGEPEYDTTNHDLQKGEHQTADDAYNHITIDLTQHGGDEHPKDLAGISDQEPVYNKLEH